MAQTAIAHSVSRDVVQRVATELAAGWYSSRHYGGELFEPDVTIDGDTIRLAINPINHMAPSMGVVLTPVEGGQSITVTFGGGSLAAMLARRGDERTLAAACSKRIERVEALQRELGVPSLQVPLTAFGRPLFPTVLWAVRDQGGNSTLARVVEVISQHQPSLLPDDAEAAVAAELEILSGCGLGRVETCAADGTPSLVSLYGGATWDIVRAAQETTPSYWMAVSVLGALGEPGEGVIEAAVSSRHTNREDLAAEIMARAASPSIGGREAPQRAAIDECIARLVECNVLIETADGIQMSSSAVRLCEAAARLPHWSSSEQVGVVVTEAHANERQWVRDKVADIGKPTDVTNAEQSLGKAQAMAMLLDAFQFRDTYEDAMDAWLKTVTSAARIAPARWATCALRAHAEAFVRFEERGMPHNARLAVAHMSELAFELAPHGGVDPLAVLGVVELVNDVPQGGDARRVMASARMAEWAGADLAGPAGAELG